MSQQINFTEYIKSQIEPQYRSTYMYILIPLSVYPSIISEDEYKKLEISSDEEYKKSWIACKSEIYNNKLHNFVGEKIRKVLIKDLGFPSKFYIGRFSDLYVSGHTINGFVIKTLSFL
jgi:hypothetical protein